jgi:uncharacterized protein involved in exopolysaccharide biosynthesis
VAQLISQSSSSEILDVRDLVALLWRRRRVIIVSTALSTVALAAYAFLATPIYRGTVVLMPASPDRGSLANSLGATLGPIGGLVGLAGIGLSSGSSNLEEALAVLQSRRFTEEFIKAKALMPILYAGRWDGRLGNWKVFPRKEPTFARASRLFEEDIRTVSRNNKTGLITLQIDWKDRVNAATWANDMVQRLNAEMRARAIAKADASLGYLRNELAGTTDFGTREAINRLIENEIKQRMLANVTEEYALRVVDRAMVLDANDPVRPRKGLLIAAGVILGFLIGVAWILISRLYSYPVRVS